MSEQNACMQMCIFRKMGEIYSSCYYCFVYLALSHHKVTPQQPTVPITRVSSQPGDKHVVHVSHYFIVLFCFYEASCTTRFIIVNSIPQQQPNTQGYPQQPSAVMYLVFMLFYYFVHTASTTRLPPSATAPSTRVSSAARCCSPAGWSDCCSTRRI